ncbi:hypothetical protein RI054_40g147600 [Pseudoscourfieldia marina]
MVMMMKQLIFFLVLVTVGLLGTSLDDNVATADVFLTHKFGYILGHKLAANVWGHEKATQVKDPNHNVTKPSIFLVRNLLDAVVSGYLYHKAGKECTVRPNSNRHMRKPNGEVKNWFKHVETQNFTKDESHTHICKVLQHRTERDGVYLYAEFAWRLWYQPYEEFVCRQHEFPLMRVHFEDLVREQSNLTVTGIAKHFLARGEMLQTNGYHGAHATSRDVRLRQRVRALVEEADKHVLESALSQSKLQTCSVGLVS